MLRCALICNKWMNEWMNVYILLLEYNTKSFAYMYVCIIFVYERLILVQRPLFFFFKFDISHHKNVCMIWGCLVFFFLAAELEYNLPLFSLKYRKKCTLQCNLLKAAVMQSRHYLLTHWMNACMYFSSSLQFSFSFFYWNVNIAAKLQKV